MEHKKLSFMEASSIITGYGVGGGIMAVPYLAERNGLLVSLLIIIAAYLASVLLHLMLAEMCAREEKSIQVVELFRKHLFKGPLEKPLSWLFFGLLALILFSTLAAYIVGAGEILSSLFGLPQWAGQVVFYLVAAGVVFFGLKILGLSEKYAVAAMAVIFLVLAGASLAQPFQKLVAVKPIGNATLALFGMIMFCFGSFFSIPQAVEGLSWNKKLITKAVFTGIGINMAFILIVTFFTIAVSQPVTEVAIIGWTAGMAGWMAILGSIFIFLAMLTTFWSVSYALVVIVRDRLNWSERASWLAATLPTLAIALLGMTTFLELMRLVGGGVAVMVSLLLVPAYRASRKQRTPETQASGCDIGFWGSTPFQILAVISYLLASAGSFITI